MIAKYLLLGALLFAQDPSISDYEAGQRELEQARLRTLSPRHHRLMITVVAQYGDGTPARGYIACDGVWCKYSDEDERCEQNLPFKTDSRGVCLFNPTPEWLTANSDSDTWSMTCHASDGARTGMLSFTPVDGGIFLITVPGVPAQ